MVGIPGVGKSTLLTTMVEILKNHKKNVIVINYGTLMFDVAQENGLKTLKLDTRTQGLENLFKELTT